MTAKTYDTVTMAARRFLAHQPVGALIAQSGGLARLRMLVRPAPGGRVAEVCALPAEWLEARPPHEVNLILAGYRARSFLDAGEMLLGAGDASALAWRLASALTDAALANARVATDEAKAATAAMRDCAGLPPSPVAATTAPTGPLPAELLRAVVRDFDDYVAAIGTRAVDLAPGRALRLLARTERRLAELGELNPWRAAVLARLFGDVVDRAADPRRN